MVTPRIQRAIKDELEKTSFVSTTTFLNETVAKLGEKLVSITPGDFEKKVWLRLSGSDANDLLFKILPKANGRPKILFFLGGYYGETMEQYRYRDKRVTRVFRVFRTS